MKGLIYFLFFYFFFDVKMTREERRVLRAYLVDMGITPSLAFEVITTDHACNVPGTSNFMDEKMFVFVKVFIAAIAIDMLGSVSLMFDQLLFGCKEVSTAFKGTRDGSDHFGTSCSPEETGDE